MSETSDPSSPASRPDSAEDPRVALPDLAPGARALVDACTDLAPDAYVALDLNWQAGRDRFETAVMVGHRLGARAAYRRAVRRATGSAEGPVPPLAALPALEGAAVAVAYGTWRSGLEAAGRALLARALTHGEPRLDVVAGAAEAVRAAAIAIAAGDVLDAPLVATLREAWDRSGAGAGPWPDGTRLPAGALPNEPDVLALVAYARSLDAEGWAALQERVDRSRALDVLGETLRRLRGLAGADPGTAEVHRRAKLLLVAALHRFRDEDPTSRDVMAALRSVEVATIALALRDTLPRGLVRISLSPLADLLEELEIRPDRRRDRVAE
ncbi:MAG TPA: hypothetical protein VFI28_09370 [Candidatus Limnocylindrales bacterium]|nr:hypothetical protein [Candidatus Limnocylindrales bacterium]